MGANAQIEVPAFTAGQVLTAAEMTQINTGIPVFATTVTRDAAFGGSGEKVLAEGQFAYIEATNTTQYYDGSAWVAVGVSGVTLISSTTLATGTTSVNNCFSATYMNYMIVLSNASASAQASLSFKFRASGTDSSTGYYAVGIEPTYSAGTYASRTASNATAVLAPIVQIQTTEKSGGQMFVQQPFEAATTSFQYLSADCNTARGTCSGSGFHNVATAYDGFSLILSTGTWSTGTVKVYGLAN
jgi:hypothetical protein